jgi:chromosome segregation ATPase
MNDLVLRIVAVVVLVAAAVWGYSAFVNHQRAIGYQQAIADVQKQENADLKAALKETIRLNGLITEANNAANERELERQRLTARIATLNGRLRDTEASIDRLVASASADALRQATAAFNTLFGECRGAYEAMGQAAQGHSDDVRTLTAAWPSAEAGQ